MSKDNLDDKLDRIARFITTPGTPTTDSHSDSQQQHYPKRYRTMARVLGGELITGEAGAYCLVRTVYPYGYRLGDIKLESPEPSVTVSHSAFSAQETEGATHPERLLFFDTETTGLGGSGAVAFLIGLGSLTAEGFEVRQYVLPDYSDETAMLEDVLAECRDDLTLVSYNGAAFDVPLVRDRMIINRVTRSFGPSDHLDLLHATRRLYRRRLGDCTLTNVEREIFGFYRNDDIPGYLIPSVYFEWLGSESLDAMEQVLEHNRFDILTLFFLAFRLNEAFVSGGRSLDRADDIHSLSRIFGRRKQHDRVVDLYRAINETAEDVAADALLYHSMALKRSGEVEEAVSLWESLAEGDGREAFLALLELAKHSEHRLRDWERAFEYTRRAKGLVPDSERQREEIQRRLERLRSRIDSQS